MTKSGSVEIKQSQIKDSGRGLFARHDFFPGDLVLSVDRPLVAELEVDRLEDSCAWCFQRGATDPVERAQAASMGLPNGFVQVKSCTGCRRVGYCSKQCQSKAWKREHKYECKVLAPKDRPPLPPHVRAVIKLLGRLKADPEGHLEDIHDILQFRPAGEQNGLENFKKQDWKRFEDFQFLSLAAWKYAGEPKLGRHDSQGVAKGFLFNVMCNTFDLTSPLDDTHYGIGFDRLICSANHSCEPNVVLVFNQPKTVLRALKPIKEGDEIFLKYTNVTNPLSVRQADLKAIYHFDCQCSKCQKGAVFAEDKFAKAPEDLSAEYCKVADKLIGRHESQLSKYLVPTTDATAQRRLAAMEAEAFSVCDNGQSGIPEIKGALEMCLKSGMWTWYRQPVPQLCRRLFGLYLESGDPYRAFRLGCKLYFDIGPTLNPQSFYPDRLITTWTLSTVTNVLCGPTHEQIFEELAKNGLELRVIYFGFLFDVYEHTPKMYGWDSPFGRVIENTYKQIMAGMVDFSKDEIKEKVDKAWPALETLARSVDASNL